MALRDQLLAEIAGLDHSDDLALWAHRRLPAKNTLTADDARIVELAYQVVLDDVHRAAEGQADQVPHPSSDLRSIGSVNGTPVVDGSAADGQQQPTAATVSPLRKPVRRRNKAHLAFVASQPCLVCQRSPCDAHHLRFAQPANAGAQGQR